MISNIKSSAFRNNGREKVEKETLSMLGNLKKFFHKKKLYLLSHLIFHYLLEILRWQIGCNCCPQVLVSKGLQWGSNQTACFPFLSIHPDWGQTQIFYLAALMVKSSADRWKAFWVQLYAVLSCSPTQCTHTLEVWVGSMMKSPRSKTLGPGKGNLVLTLLYLCVFLLFQVSKQIPSYSHYFGLLSVLICFQIHVSCLWIQI